MIDHQMAIHQPKMKRLTYQRLNLGILLTVATYIVLGASYTLAIDPTTEASSTIAIFANPPDIQVLPEKPLEESESLKADRALQTSTPLSQASAEEVVAAIEAHESQRTSGEPASSEGQVSEEGTKTEGEARGARRLHQFLPGPPPNDFSRGPPPRLHRFAPAHHQHQFMHGRRPPPNRGPARNPPRPEELNSAEGKPGKDLASEAQTLYDLRGFHNQLGQQIGQPPPQQFNSFNIQQQQQHQPFDLQPQRLVSSHFNLNPYHTQPIQHHQPQQHQPQQLQPQQLQPQQLQPQALQQQQNQNQIQELRNSPLIFPSFFQPQDQGISDNEDHLAGHTQTRHGNIFGHNQHHQAIFDQAKTNERSDFRPSQIDPSLTKLPAVAVQSTTASPTDNQYSFTPVHHPFVTARPHNQLEQQEIPQPPQQSERQQPDKQESFVYVYEDVDYVEEPLKEPVKTKERQKQPSQSIKTNQATAILIDTSTVRPSAVQLPQPQEQIQYQPQTQLNSLEEEEEDPRQQNYIQDDRHLQQHRPLLPLSGVGFASPNVEIVPSSERKPPPDQSNAIRPLTLTTTQKPIHIGRFAGVRDNVRTTTTSAPEPISFDRYEQPRQPEFELSRPSFEEELTGPSAEPPTNNILNQFVRRPSSQRQTSPAPPRTTTEPPTKAPRRPQPTSPQLLTSGPDDLSDNFDYFNNEPQVQNFGRPEFRPENQNGPQQFGRPENQNGPQQFGRPENQNGPQQFGRPNPFDEQDSFRSNFGRPQQFGRPAGPEPFGRQERPEQFARPTGPEQFGGPARPENFGRPEKFARPERPEQFATPERPQQFGRPEQFERPEEPENFRIPERPEPSPTPERPEPIRRPEPTRRPERPEPTRRPERPERPEPSRRPERPEPNRRPERPEPSRRPERPEPNRRPERPEPTRRPEPEQFEIPEQPEQFIRPERPSQSFSRPDNPFQRPESPSPFTQPERTELRYNAPAPTRGRPTTTNLPPPPTTTASSASEGSQNAYEPQVLRPFQPKSQSDEDKQNDNAPFSPQRIEEPLREVEEPAQVVTRRPPLRSSAYTPTIRSTTRRTTTTTTTTPEPDDENSKPVRNSIRNRFPSFRSTSSSTTAAPTTEAARKRPPRIRGRQPGRIHKASTTPLPEVNQELDADYEAPSIAPVSPSPTAPARIRSRPSFRVSTTTPSNSNSRPVRIHDSVSTRGEGSRHVFDRPTGRGPSAPQFESEFRDPEQERPNRFAFDRPTGRGPTNPPKPPTPPPRKTGKPLYYAGKMLAKEGGVYAGYQVPAYHTYGSPIPLIPVNQVFDRIPDHFGPPPRHSSPARTLPPLAPHPTFSSPSGPSPTFQRGVPAVEVSDEFDPNAHRNFQGKHKLNLSKLSRNRNTIQATTPESKPTESVRHTTAIEGKFVRKQKYRGNQNQDEQFSPSAPSPSAPGRTRLSGGRKKRPYTTTTTTTSTTEQPYVVQVPYLPVNNEPGVLTISEEHHTEPAPVYSTTYSTPRPLIIQEETPRPTTPKPLRRRPGGRPTFQKPKPSLPTGNADEPQVPQPKPLPPRKLRQRIRANRRPRPTGPQPVDEQQPEEAKEIHEREAPPPPQTSTTVPTTPEPPTTLNTQSSVRISKKPTEAPGRFSSRFREENPPFTVTKTPIQLTTKTRPSFKPKTTKRSTTTTAVPRTTARRKIPPAEDNLPPSVRLTAEDVLKKRKPARRLKPGSISLKLQEKRQRILGSRRTSSSPYSGDSEESNEAFENANNKREVANQDAVYEPDNLLDEELRDEGNSYNSTEADSEETAAVLGIPKPTNGTNLEVVSVRVSTESPRVYDEDEDGFLGFASSTGRKAYSPSPSKFSNLQLVMQRRDSTSTTDSDIDSALLTTQTPFNSEGARAIVSASLTTSYTDSVRSKLKINESQEAQESMLKTSTVQATRGQLRASSPNTSSPFSIFTMATQEPSLPLEAFFPIVSQNSKEAIS